MEPVKRSLLDVIEEENRERKKSRNALIWAAIVFILMIPVDIWLYGKITAWRDRQEIEQPPEPVERQLILPIPANRPPEPVEKMNFAQDPKQEKKLSSECSNWAESGGQKYCIDGDKLIKANR